MVGQVTERPDDDEQDDLYGQDSFPASDPPSSWWGASRNTADARSHIKADDDSDRLRRAASELMRRGSTGVGPTETTVHYRQLELAELLRVIARAVDHGVALPRDLVRHAANLARHILDYPAGPAEATIVSHSGDAGGGTVDRTTSKGEL